MNSVTSAARTALSLCLFGVAATLYSAPSIASLKSSKARHLPGEAVHLTVDLAGDPARQFRTVLTLEITHLGAAVAKMSKPAILEVGKSAKVEFSWNPPKNDFVGYAVEAQLSDQSGRALDRAWTAVDVSSTWTKFPRYGYLSKFPEQDGQVSEDIVEGLKDFHINSLQFYDWQSSHHRPLAGTVESPSRSWKDIANRSVYRQTVADLIMAARRRGVATMNYNLLHGAYEGYGEDGSGVRPEWGLFHTKSASNQWSLGLPDSWAAKRLYLFNPANPDWQSYLIGREREVFQSLPFDGWHVDQTGGPSEPVYDFRGSSVDLWTTFRGFLNRAKAELNRPIIFNNVGTYGMFDTCANSRVDAVYVECWPSAGQRTYSDLKKVIDEGREWSKGKGVILAAYMNYEFAQKAEGQSAKQFNLPGVLLINSAILASGGWRLELGDNGAMLCHEYFPNVSLTPSSELLKAVRIYSSFAVACQNLLREGPPLKGGDISASVPASDLSLPGKVWSFSNKTRMGHTINLINLIGVPGNDWRDDKADKPEPKLQKDVSIKYYTDDPLTKAYWGSPDRGSSALSPLQAELGRDEKGRFIKVLLPSLKYWSLIYFTG